MIIRNDFVSNSSSCSFIIRTDKNVSQKLVAKDFVDFACNTSDFISDYDEYKRVYLQNLENEDTLPKIKKMLQSEKYIRLKFKTEHEMHMKYASKEYFDYCIDKIINLFSLFPDQRVCTSFNFDEAEDKNSKKLPTGTAKLTSQEIRDLLKRMKTSIRRLQRVLNVLDKWSNEQYQSYKEKLSLKDIKIQRRLWYGVVFDSKKEAVKCINDYLKFTSNEYNIWMEKLDFSLDNIDKYCFYCVTISYSGDGECSDTIYTLNSITNSAKYIDEQYCFSIVVSEYL